MRVSSSIGGTGPVRPPRSGGRWRHYRCSERASLTGRQTRKGRATHRIARPLNALRRAGQSLLILPRISPVGKSGVWTLA